MGAVTTQGECVGVGERRYFFGWVDVTWFGVVFGCLVFVMVFRWDMGDDRNNAESTSTVLEKRSRPLDNRRSYSVSLAWV